MPREGHGSRNRVDGDKPRHRGRHAPRGAWE